MSEPLWLEIARKDVGLRELTGAPTAPKIAGWLRDLKAWWKDDETPWCGVAVAAWMQQSGEPLPKHWYRAKGWLDWGKPCRPQSGAVVIFERDGGGHVGLAVGYDDQRAAILVLGGNQGNAVSISPLAAARAIGWRWPLDKAEGDTLPMMASTQDFSRNEA